VLVQPYYSSDDVARWLKIDQQSITLHLNKLEGEMPQTTIDFHLYMLAGSYYLHGMTCIAQNSFGAAIDAFRASAETRCKMYERYNNGLGRSLEAGHFQSLLIAFVTMERALVSRFVHNFRADEGTPGSVFLGRALKLVALNDLESAKNELARKKPRFEPQFIGYAECLDAIAGVDVQRFTAALNLASASWAKWAVKRAKGLPESVCFIHGIGLVRLAERVIGSRVIVIDEHIPGQLLQ
jgi:hypothetical protein